MRWWKPYGWPQMMGYSSVTNSAGMKQLAMFTRSSWLAFQKSGSLHVSPPEIQCGSASDSVLEVPDGGRILIGKLAGEDRGVIQPSQRTRLILTVWNSPRRLGQLACPHSHCPGSRRDSAAGAGGWGDLQCCPWLQQACSPVKRASCFVSR